jgi:predicted nicotinamide N-methyase
MANNNSQKPIFAYQIEKITVADLVFKLCMIKNLDEALDHYIQHAVADTDKIPYFTRLWESAQAMACCLTEEPALCRNRRVLELGCGLGLPAMTAAKLGASEVTATDFHPDNEAFFLNNALLNDLEDIRYCRLDWRQPNLAQSYDLLIGSDLIYERSMIAPLASCARQLCASGGRFILADPGRNNLQEAASSIEEQGFSMEIRSTDSIFLLFFTRQ